MNTEQPGHPEHTRNLAYRHFRESIVHLYRDCPEGKLIGIARREAVHDEAAVEGLEVCVWCQGRAGEG